MGNHTWFYKKIDVTYDEVKTFCNKYPDGMIEFG